ncbi:MAG: hypothetical protein HY273_04985 [Gammaproteobacteria bacterium]|nr:hypothetical protein [Gammaproteobacteria bacterium]
MDFWVRSFNIARAFATVITSRGWPALACVVVSLLVTFPVTDPDTYWHLANGRAMVEQGRIVNEEIFSYTQAGTAFSNHEWLAQIVLYLSYQLGEWWGVIALRLVLALCVTLLVYATCRRLGTPAALACIASIIAVLCGLHRYSPRPELFSLIGVAWLGFFIHSFQQHFISNRAAWTLPPLMLVWDWLHGAIFGVLILSALAVGENIKPTLLKWFPDSALFSTLSPERRRTLNISLLVTLIVMLLNPYGLLSYDIFFDFVHGNALVNIIAEFTSPSWQSYRPFWIFLVIASTLVALNWRRVDLTWWLLLVPFTYLAMRYLRMIEIYCILAAPIVTALLTHAMRSAVVNKIMLPGIRNGMAAVAVIGITLYIGWSKFADNSAFTRFGIGTDTTYYPEGIVRMINDIGLSGRMYNTGHLGGYLAFYLSPQNKIFQYNHHTVFGNTWRWVTDPHSLDVYDIDFAIISEEPELRMFPAEQWAIVYKDKKVFLLLRRNLEHTALIGRYEVHYFLANQAALTELAGNPQIYPQLMLETSTYLTYRRDAKVAYTFANLMNVPASFTLGGVREQLLSAACKANADDYALNCPRT